MSDAAEALDAYVQALLDGEARDVDAWMAEHPGLDAALREELELVASLHRAAGSVAADAESGDEESLGAPRLIAVGTQLGEYVVEELIGAGGMGEVYRARHEVMGRDVALKVLRPYLVDEPDAVERFRREVKAQASLGPHPHVVTAMHASEHEGRLYLVMEYVPGTNLSRLVRAEGPLEPARAARLIRQAAEGLAHAHAAGIVHRDVKPSNLLLTEDERVKVVDLGLARLAQARDETARPSWVDELVGSLDYMAPEQANRPDDADARSDLYALGCTLYFLLEGRPPFADRLALKKLMAHAVDPPPPLTRAVPAPLRAVLSRLLEKDPEQRYASAEELLAALDEAVPHSGEPTTRSEASRPTPRGRRDARNRWLLGGAALLLLLTTVALLGVLLTRKPPATLGVDTPVAGRLDPGDGVRPKDHAYFESHVVEVEGGETYLVTMTSQELDPMLLVRADGWEVARSDDAPHRGLSAQLVWTAEQTGPVELVATTPIENAEGTYVISLERLTMPALSLDAEVTGTLEAGDARHTSDDSLLDRYWLSVEAGETYVLSLRGEGFLPFLFLETSERQMFAGSRPVEGEQNEVRLVHVAEQGGVLFVAANAQRPGDAGRYRLSVASELAGDEVLQASGILSEGDPTLGDESYYDEHPLPVRAGHTYVITMRSEDFDTYLLLVDPDGERVAQNDDAMGTDSRIVFRAREDAQMVVQANSFTSGMQGQYTLTVRELPESGPR